NNVTNDSSKSKPGGIGLALRRGLSRVALFWERSWPAIWPATGLIGTFAALALLNVLPALPGWLHTLILLGFAAAFLAALRHAFRRVRVPTADAATRRLETDSGLAHRPLTTLEDRP
ncbi:unnamed protein product, partial [Laminaria digitata]